MDQATIALETTAQVTAAEAQVRGQEARSHLDCLEHQEGLDSQLATAREDLLVQLAAGASAAELAASTRRWMAAAITAEPTEKALRMAAASSAGRVSAAQQVIASTLRHDGIAHLMPSTKTTT